MESKLSVNQAIELRNRMRNDTFDKEYEVQTLVRSGCHPDTADLLITNVILGFQDQLAEEIEEAKEKQNKREVACILVIASALFISALGDNSLIYIVISLVIAFLAGYFGFPQKRIPAIAGFVAGTIIMTFLLSFYSEDGNSKLLIKLGVSYGIGFLVYYGLSKLLYSKRS